MTATMKAHSHGTALLLSRWLLQVTQADSSSHTAEEARILRAVEAAVSEDEDIDPVKSLSAKVLLIWVGAWRRKTMQFEPDPFRTGPAV